MTDLTERLNKDFSRMEREVYSISGLLKEYLSREIESFKQNVEKAKKLLDSEASREPQK